MQTLVLEVDAQQGVSWGSIPPLSMPKPPSSWPLPWAEFLMLAPSIEVQASALDEDLVPSTDWRGILRGLSQLTQRLDFPEAWSAFAYAEASFLMTFAMGRVPHAGSQQLTICYMQEHLWKIVTNRIRLEKIEYLLKIIIIHNDQSKEDTPALVSAVG